MSASQFDELKASLESLGPRGALEALAASLREQKKYPQLFEALLMKKRQELGLPLVGADVFRDLPEAQQAEVEDYYVGVCRELGSLYLADGDIASAWPYFRAIDEPQKVAEALDRWRPPAPESSGSTEPSVASTDAIVDIALYQGANPQRGYELVLSEYGVCRAITVIEHQFPHSSEVKEKCAEMLLRRLHKDLVENLRADIRRKEETLPEETDVRKLIDGRPWLFGDYGYHVDVSHLQSAIRVAGGVRKKEVLELALQLTEYGRKLPRDFQTNDRPPFDDFYNDYRIFLQALAGIGADGAVRYFTQKADRFGLDEDGKHFPGEILVLLLHRLGRYAEAVDAHIKYLAGCRGPLLAAPTLFELSSLAKDYSKLLEQAVARDDLLQFAAGLIAERAEVPPD
jgi:hypothetical protein